MKAEIIAIGSEMLTPYRQDTNSLFITEKLNGVGVGVAFKTIVGDRRKDLVNAIRSALGRTDILIMVGGLGPTEDDLTREAAAEALGLTLHRDNQQVAALHARAATWRIAMPSNNLTTMADVIKGAALLTNPNGSAPGQWIDTLHEGYRKLIMLIPGPPAECKPLFESEMPAQALREGSSPRYFIARAHALKSGDDPGSRRTTTSCWRRSTPNYTRSRRRPSWRMPGISSVTLLPLLLKPAEENSGPGPGGRTGDQTGRGSGRLALFFAGRFAGADCFVLPEAFRQATLAIAESCTGAD